MCKYFPGNIFHEVCKMAFFSTFGGIRLYYCTSLAVLPTEKRALRNALALEVRLF